MIILFVFLIVLVPYSSGLWCPTISLGSLYQTGTICNTTLPTRYDSLPVAVDTCPSQLQGLLGASNATYDPATGNVEIACVSYGNLSAYPCTSSATVEVTVRTEPVPLNPFQTGSECVLSYQMQEKDSAGNPVQCYQEYLCPFPSWGADEDVTPVESLAPLADDDGSCEECLSVAVGYTNDFAQFSNNPVENPCTKNTPWSNSSLPVLVDNFNRMMFAPFGSVNASLAMEKGEPTLHFQCSDDDEDHCTGDEVHFTPTPLSHLKDACHLTFASFDRTNGFCFSSYVCRFSTYAPGRAEPENLARITRNHERYQRARHLAKQAKRLGQQEQATG